MSSIPSKRPSIADQVAEAQRRAAEIKARLAGGSAARNNAGVAARPVQPPQASGSSTSNDATDRVAALRARLAAAQAKVGQNRSPAPPPPPPPPPAPTPVIKSRYDTVPARDEGGDTARGVSMGVHPALLGRQTLKEDEAKPGDGRRNQRQKEKEKLAKAQSNPYLPDGGAAGPSRKQRELHFNHNMQERPAMAAANEMRKKAAMEAMKKRIDEKTRAAGLDDGVPITGFVIPMPPDVEFWDEGLEGTDIDSNPLISNLVLHPIQIEPPQDRLHTLKPATLMLTTKEQKKMRRIRRAEEHKEEQAKIRLGLVPQPEPKVNHKNVMRVHGEMAVKDPTAVDALVNRQIRERLQAHEQANEARKLTKEERDAKRKEQAAANAAMGLQMTVYRIALNKETLLPKHRFLINLNAQQRHDLTGVVLVGPSLSLALVEGGSHSINQYKKLMLKRIKWAKILAGGGDVEHAAMDEAMEVDTETNTNDSAETSSDTTCKLLWQGEVRDRKFKKWGGLREVETELQAVDALKRVKLDNFWTLAKSTAN